MKYVKMLGVLAVVAGALMALAGTASATALTSEGKIYSGPITAVNESKYVSLTGPLGIAIECEEAHVNGTVSSQTPASTTVKGSITALKFAKCTNGIVVHVNTLGTLEGHTQTAGVNNGNGTITSSGTTVTVTNTPVGTCAYLTNNTDIGLLTGSVNTKGHATFDISATIPRHGGSAFCGASGIWEGNYTITTPKDLNIH